MTLVSVILTPEQLQLAASVIAGKTQTIKYYNPDVVISVGYRVKSIQGTQFRIWATNRLKEYLVRGYSINRQRFVQNAAELKQALALIQKTAHSPSLETDMGRVGIRLSVASTIR